MLTVWLTFDLKPAHGHQPHDRERQSRATRVSKHLLLFTFYFLYSSSFIHRLVPSLTDPCLRSSHEPDTNCFVWMKSSFRQLMAMFRRQHWHDSGKGVDRCHRCCWHRPHVPLLPYEQSRWSEPSWFEPQPPLDHLVEHWRLCQNKAKKK